MNAHPSVMLGAGSVAIIAVVNGIAVSLAPAGAAFPMQLCGVAAALIGLQSAVREPPALTWALLASVPPVIALLAAGSPTWLIGTLAASLLVAGELNALSWEFRGALPTAKLAWRRVRQTLQLGALGMVASVAVGVVAVGSPLGGTVATVLAATALAVVGWVVFGRAT